MPTLARLAACATAFAFALTLGAQSLQAQDPVVVDPANYKVVYEDDDVRVIEYRDKPGYKGPIHSHERPYVVYVLNTVWRQFNTLDKAGGCTVKGKIVELKRHQVLSPAVPIKHCEANVGTTDTFLIVVEDKRKQPNARPASRPAARVSSRRRP